MEMKKLDSLSGSDFDRTFAKRNDQRPIRKTSRRCSRRRNRLCRTPVRTLVADTLPTLQKHLELAQKIYGQPS